MSDLVVAQGFGNFLGSHRKTRASSHGWEEGLKGDQNREETLHTDVKDFGLFAYDWPR